MIHKILGEMVHGNTLETRISHIEALRSLRAWDDEN